MRKIAFILFLVSLPFVSLAQSHKVSGVVTEINTGGQAIPVAGATVMVKGSTVGTMT